MTPHASGMAWGFRPARSAPFFAALALALLAPGAARAVTDPGCSTMAIVQRASTVTYGLGRTFLREGSDSVWTSARAFVSGQDYALDRMRGVIRLRVEPVPGETLWVHACGLMQPPALEYRKLSYRPNRSQGDSTADSLAAAPAARPATFGPAATEASGASLSLTGNKTIAVEFGSNQDAFLRQSLDLAVTGTLAPGIELTGALSDRNTPLTAAGSTRDIQSLDRLLIELKAPQGGAALGDVGLSLDRGEFARLDRRLQGARAEWTSFGVQGIAAAASAQGEFQSLQLYGVEGRQGPYFLTTQSGSTTAVVAGSEIVTLDGERMTRGESADYSMDYERGGLTFTNRRPISSASRITVDYQVAVSRFRRNFAATAAQTDRGPWHSHFAFVTEADDRGRPLSAALDETDRLVLAAAGDSADRAVGAGVTVGVGDYVLVADSLSSHYAFAGPDSGRYQISFAQVGPGRGDYADSTTALGQPAFRWVGAGRGSYRVGRLLPLPDSRQLWDLGQGLHVGGLALDLEGALSRYDRNTFSSLDDQDDVGGAGSARLSWEAAAPGWSGARVGLSGEFRQVGSRFAPFTRLERPFEQEDWGLPVGSDLEHQRRAAASVFARPSARGELRADLGRLETPDGFSSLRRQVQWNYTGVLVTRAQWERADGVQEGREFRDGGRDRKLGEIALALPWLQPKIHADWDERWAPSDSTRAGDRYREIGGELRSGPASGWRVETGYVFRRSGGMTPGGWTDRDDARTARFGFQSPEPRPWSSSVEWQRRTLRSLVDSTGRTVSDLASAHLRGTDVRRGLGAALGLEVTSEGDPSRTRQLTFVGAGLGAYDSLGNFVGTGHGDRDLVIATGTVLRRVSRASASTHLSWQPPGEGAWQGSRVEATLETDARRLGAFDAGDAALSPRAAVSDSGLSRGAVTQRLEADFAPAARFAALNLRLERRVTADRGFTNFAQTQDIRQATLRWRGRPAVAWTTEIEGKLIRSGVRLGGATNVERTVREGGMTGRLGFSPGATLRLALVGDGSWSHEEGGPEPWSSAWTFGPELGLTLFRQGRLEVTSRRTLRHGEPLSAELPFGDPLGAINWETTGRFDYRLREQTTVGVSLTSRDREGRPSESEGRAEVRAFF